MPYIKQERRDRIYEEQEVCLEHYQVESCGELNYLFTKAIQAYIETQGLSYQTINDIVGALESSKLEFYRRVAVPYENTKMCINGDVYTDTNNIDLGGC